MNKLVGVALAVGTGFGVTKFLNTQKAKNAQIHDPYSKTGTFGMGKVSEDVPGDKLGVKKLAVDSGANLTQKFSPLNAIHQHVCSIHFYSGDMNRQVAAHHFCSHLNDDVLQCVMYDSDKPDAKLIGIEYLISEKLFKTLPEEEKKLWHSHVYEVKSGLMFAPRTADMVEKEIMKEVIQTYGKAIFTWQVEKDALPLGIPQLMMEFTAPGQVDLNLVKARDQYYGVQTADRRKLRADLQEIKIDPKADYWEKSGKAVQFQTTEVNQKNRQRVAA